MRERFKPTRGRHSLRGSCHRNAAAGARSSDSGQKLMNGLKVAYPHDGLDPAGDMPNLLLIGAGFSRNWGGWLATEAFEHLL